MQLKVVLKPRQDQNCSMCPHINKCRSRRTAHGKPLSDRNDTINLLVCRLKLGLNKDKVSIALLSMMKPGMINLVTQAKKRSGNSRVSVDDMIMDMQSFTIESILTKYKIGELNPITNFLFDIKSGYLVKWAKWYVTKASKWEFRNELTDDPYKELMDDNHESEEGEEHTVSGHHVEQDDITYSSEEHISYVDDIMAVIDDGITFNASEFRVLKFALQNANEGNSVRLVDGLHIHQAARMRVSRPRATRLYKRSLDRLRIIYKEMK